MKTRFFLAALLLAFGSMRASENETLEVNAIRVTGSGDVRVQQAPTFSLMRDGQTVTEYRMERGWLVLSGSYDYEVALPQLNKIELNSSGDIYVIGALKGSNLEIDVSGSGDVRIMQADYDTIWVNVRGSGDVTLAGQCQVLYADLAGSGELFGQGLKIGETNANVTGSGGVWTNDPESLSELMRELGMNLERLSDSVDWKSFEEDMEKWGADMEEWGRKMEKWGRQYEDKYGKNYEHHYENNNRCPAPKEDKPKDKRPEKKNLLFDAHWNGFGAGLNVLLGPGSTANFEGDYAFLEQRPLRSWVFNFNIADVGIAFDRRHTAGLFTGVGLGWNNYSFNNPVRLVKGENYLEGEWIDPNVAIVKKSKLGVLYLQVPLMLEVRPTRRFNIAAGVTGGLRIDTWTNVKFQNGDSNKVHSDYYVNPFKLDASLRVGGENLGFFADFNLLPTFDDAHAPTCHTASFGFSINF